MLQPRESYVATWPGCSFFSQHLSTPPVLGAASEPQHLSTPPGRCLFVVGATIYHTFSKLNARYRGFFIDIWDLKLVAACHVRAFTIGEGK